MKAWQIMLFLMCLNASFYLLSLTGLYFSDPLSDYSIAAKWTGTDLLLSFVGVFVTAATVGIILSRFGVRPFQTAAFTAFTVSFISLYAGFVKILTTIGTMMGPAKLIMDGFILILTMVMAILVLYTCVQMGVGGAKSFD